MYAVVSLYRTTEIQSKESDTHIWEVRVFSDLSEAKAHADTAETRFPDFSQPDTEDYYYSFWFSSVYDAAGAQVHSTG